MQVIGKLGLACLAWLSVATLANAKEGYAFCSAEQALSRSDLSSKFIRRNLYAERKAVCLQGSKDRLKERVCSAEAKRSVNDDVDRRETVFFTDHLVANHADLGDIQREFQSYLDVNYPYYLAKCAWSSSRIESEAERGREIRKVQIERKRNIVFLDLPFAPHDSRGSEPDVVKPKSRAKSD